MIPEIKIPAKVQTELQDVANRIRVQCILSTEMAKSGHPTSCSSVAEILSVLFFYVMRYKVTDLKNPLSDRFVFSKAHAAPALYAVWAEVGLYPSEELHNLRQLHSLFEGHPTPRLEFIDVATGSLGQGLSFAAGMAYIGKYFDKANYRVYCLAGDGESAEGSMWEAISFCSYYKLNNLCLILDVNRWGQSEPTMLQHDLHAYKKRFNAFGFHAVVVDGHNCLELINGFELAALVVDKPTVILAKTFKGKSFPEIEDQYKWHAHPLGKKHRSVVRYLKRKIRSPVSINITHKRPLPDDYVPKVCIDQIKLSSGPSYKMGSLISTKEAYGNALVKLAESNPRVLVFDSDASTFTGTDIMKENFPDRTIECYLSHQNVIGVAVGAALRDRCISFCATHASLLSRAFDQIRIAAISNSKINICGCNGGVISGPYGPGYMGLQDIAMFRTLPGCIIFYPSDAVSAERAVELAANAKCITYIRTITYQTPILYGKKQLFKIGQAMTVRCSSWDKILIVSAGITLIEALTASDILETTDYPARVVDLFTIKPVDKEALIRHAKVCSGKVIAVEDHHYEGGIGETVAAVFAEEPKIIVRRLAIAELPHSGHPDDLIRRYGLNCEKIIEAIEDILEVDCIFENATQESGLEYLEGEYRSGR